LIICQNSDIELFFCMSLFVTYLPHKYIISHIPVTVGLHNFVFGV
jgi:hypothetical protein